MPKTVEQLKEEAKKTFDVEKRKRLQNVAKSEQEAENELAKEAALEEQLNQQQQQQLKPPRQRPAWLTPAEKTMLHLVGFDNKAFNEKNFLASLASMGLKDIKTLAKDGKYLLSYGKGKFVEFNVRDNTINTNDLSATGFNNIAKIARAGGAHSLDFTSLLKQQLKNPNLSTMLNDAYKATKNECLTMVGLGDKESLIKSHQKNPGQTSC